MKFGMYNAAPVTLRAEPYQTGYTVGVEVLDRPDYTLWILLTILALVIMADKKKSKVRPA